MYLQSIVLEIIIIFIFSIFLFQLNYFLFTFVILFSNIRLLSFGFLNCLIAVNLRFLFDFFQLLLIEFAKITFFSLEYLDLVRVFGAMFIIALASF